MNSIVYVVPWAICDTDNVYIRKTENDGTAELVPGTAVDDWTVREVIPSPDKSSGDLYVILDVYGGYRFTEETKKNVRVVRFTNSSSRLTGLGYEPAEEQERTFIRRKVLKISEAV